MGQSTISPNKADEFGIKIAKDGVLRSSNEILTQKGVDMNKIRKFGLIYLFLAKKLMNRLKLMLIIGVI